MSGQNSGCVQFTSPRFPPQLKEVVPRPVQLCFQGSYEDYHFSQDVLVAVVGTRHPSQYGLSMTQKIATELASWGVVIVSGLALGIDTAAHRAALKANGRTIAVLGCGINKIYPSDNKKLAQEIVRHGGLILSEYPGEQTVDREHFRARNRLISGLCRAVLVIEGTARSGTLLTAKYALEQGREVMALPGLAGTAAAEAPHLLLKQGASLVTSSQDVLDCLGLVKRYNRAND
jgi:DNA processing protein